MMSVCHTMSYDVSYNNADVSFDDIDVTMMKCLPAEIMNYDETSLR